jgi:hypothetical protein
METPKHLAHTKDNLLHIRISAFVCMIQRLDHPIPIDIQGEVRRVEEAIWSPVFANLRYNFPKVNTTK